MRCLLKSVIIEMKVLITDKTSVFREKCCVKLLYFLIVLGITGKLQLCFYAKLSSFFFGHVDFEYLRYKYNLKCIVE